MSKIINYFKETKIELKHVVWPKKTQVIVYSFVVIVLSILIAYFLSIFDFLFSEGLGKLLNF